MEERVLTRFEAAPSTRTRAEIYEIDISQSVVWSIVQEERIHPYDMQSVQSLDAYGFIPARQTLCSGCWR
ncbi:hypothetical protein TNCV_2363791 [Trichonephila clavipes]|nr:hypothetical protein TNCV_2363791 [Trichonephila clavipes]